MSGIDPEASDPSSVALAEQRLLHALEQVPESSHYLIALSGGLDSSCLLRLAVPVLRSKGALVEAVHVNHGLSDNASDWEAFCLRLSNELGVHCYIERVQVKVHGDGWEAAARKARYQAFSHYLRADSVLLLAHHLDDQLETVMMRILQRRHVMTLSGIPQQRLLATGVLFRPWLTERRDVLLQIARANDWEWVEDESNQDQRFTRNRVRNRLLPDLFERNSSLESSIIALSRAALALKKVEERLMSWAFDYCEGKTHKLSVPALLSLSDAAQRQLLRFWIDHLGVEQPPDSILNRVWREVLNAKPDSSPMLQWGGVRLHRFADMLFVLPAGSTKTLPELAYKVPLSELPGKWQVGVYTLSLALLKSANDVDSESVSNDGPCECRDVLSLPAEASELLVRNRRPGDRFASGGGNTQELKKLWRNLGIPPWWRSHMPLLEFEGALLWAGPGLIAPEFLSSDTASKKEDAEAGVDRLFLQVGMSGPDLPPGIALNR